MVSRAVDVLAEVSFRFQRRRARQARGKRASSLDILVSDGLDVEADGGDSGDALIQLELVEDGCGSV